MIVVDLEPDGSAPWEILRKYGGRFGLFQRIKMGGVGSPKIVYKSGIPEFDEIEAEPVSDACYINFEYLKYGLLGRLNKGQKLKGFILAFDEIEEIRFEKINNVEPFNNAFTNTQESQMTITLQEGKQLKFQVNEPVLLSIQNYFQKRKELVDVLFLK